LICILNNLIKKNACTARLKKKLHNIVKEFWS